MIDGPWSTKAMGECTPNVLRKRLADVLSYLAHGELRKPDREERIVEAANLREVLYHRSEVGQ